MPRWRWAVAMMEEPPAITFPRICLRSSEIASSIALYGDAAPTSAEGSHTMDVRACAAFTGLNAGVCEARGLAYSRAGTP